MSATQAAKSILGNARRKLGWDKTNWLRVTQIRSWREFLTEHANGSDMLEVSPGWNNYWSKFECKSYRAVQYPEFDIGRDVLSEQFDIVIADQVLEHVKDASLAVKHIFQMVRPGGHAMIAAPFLFRVHGRPYDFNRWTEDGLRALLIAGGFDDKNITSYAWGNKACARAHIGGPVQDFGFGRDLSNDPEYPIMVWAFARQPE